MNQWYNEGMGLIVNNQNDQRSRLQEQIAAELQQRAREKNRATELPDGVNDSAFIKGTKQTTTLAWVWILIVIAAVGCAFWLIASLQG